MYEIPHLVVVFSGKRKSGKDYVTDLIQRKLGNEVCAILRLSGPLKGQYAKEHGLDFNKLLDATEYKEKYRAKMIIWGEEKRNRDPSFFCHLATQGLDASRPVWLISDARRVTDMEYFISAYGCKTLKVRVVAEEDVRQGRGWKFADGVDNAESECGLDKWPDWDYVVENNGDNELLSITVDSIIQRLSNNLSLPSNTHR